MSKEIGLEKPPIDELMHYGIARRSGRYPWGSGDGPQRNMDFLSRLEELKKNGFVENAENIKKEFGISMNEFRNEKTICNYERRMLQVNTAKALKLDGLNNVEIGKKMGINESTVRSLLNPKSEDKMQEVMNTVNFLKERVDDKKMIDVGAGVNIQLGISKEKLDTALYYLEGEGYKVYGGGIAQPTNRGQQTNQKVLCVPGTEPKDIYEFDKIHSITDYTSKDGGETFNKFRYPESMNSDRLMIRYAEDGGIHKDGVVELRRGVPDLSLGNDHYSQVRILVDGNKYIKGMAVYGKDEDFPPGVDAIFNTNKTKDVPKMKVLKEIKDDPDNPFGSLIKPNGQSDYVDAEGNKKMSLINKRAGEGDWSEWKDTIPSQFLAKQSKHLAKKQLDLAKIDKINELEEIMALSNPTVKKHFLQKFADEADSAAVHLKAAALPGQKYHVILPVNSLKDTEVYAPNYENGTKIALIRYPHGGKFEIPILTVNNKHKAARELLGTDIKDAVGINSKIAEILSGADFDGDTVMCIPTGDKNGRVNILNKSPLKELENFDHKTQYKEREGMRYIKNPITKKDSTQIEMGIISNLITDMTVGGATDSELARAVRHSMVVIDAAKHKLDYKQSEIDNDIAGLKKKWQTGGASTILSRAKGQIDVDKRRGSPKINTPGKPWYNPDRPEGALVYTTADPYEAVKVNKRTGEITTYLKQPTQKSTKMLETDDAYSLVSDSRHQIELIYADYANSMKALANTARKELVSTGNLQYSRNANKVYANEVASLSSKLNEVLINAPKERAALRSANVILKNKTEANPDMTNDDYRKEAQRAITASRVDVGSLSRRDRSITITDKEWEAIQAGAVTENVLSKILNNADVDELRQRATPRKDNTISENMQARIKAYKNSNYTNDEIARKLGISVSTVNKY